jgi:hypothetical protein
MKLTKVLVILAAALGLMAFASTASATTLEVKGVKQNVDITIKASLKAGTSLLHTDTIGNLLNTCTVSTFEGADSTATTATRVSGPISALSFSSCTEGNPVVHTRGSFSIEWLKILTHGTVRWHSGDVTTPSPFGTLTCSTPAAGTDIGTLTGVASGNATLDVNAVLNCGITTTKLTGTYTVTSPEGLGVVE